MNYRLHTFLATAALLVAITPDAHADRLESPRRFGLGLELGAPTGLSAKYFLGGMVAIQGGVGVVESFGDDGLHLHAEVVWHPAVLHHSRDVTIPLHVGVGGRFLDHDDDDMACYNGRYYYDCDDDTHLGLRAPIGVSFILGQVPMDIFLELALVVDLVHVDDDEYYDDDHDHAGLHGALGGRFYF